ncbi:hypothetical protein TanjilG_15870 [Lupinus angustifolius]|uniref:Uncharacterized protein n=1 Tax=Lupinus angustifolius TaxID=3871 RepID=A0A1J7FNL6_LUPAN|nr:hypothetical protein TanjilG_15870 [Lupinus angustifolius]
MDSNTRLSNYLAFPYAQTEDEVLIPNQAFKEELHDIENVGNQLVEEPVECRKFLELMPEIIWLS